MSEQGFRQELQHIMEKQFMQFDVFIIRKMGFDVTKQGEDIRYDAFHEFRKRTGRVLLASMPTMRRWFGIGGFHPPDREHVIHMCFALSLEPDEAEEYLTKGIAEPSFQINDYYEILFLYGLYHHLSYEDCLKMADAFEENRKENIVFSGTKSTKELLASFEIHKTLQREEFLLWMSDRADWFKGYSRTTLNYLTRLREYILGELREDAKVRLDELLRETEYERWRRQHTSPENEREAIERFLGKGTIKRKRYQVSDMMRKCILELAKLAYDTRQLNSRILSEVFANTDSSVIGFRKYTPKYLSDLFHIPEKKQQAIWISQALRVLDTLSMEEMCPEWILLMGNEYTRQKGDFSSVEEAKKTLVKLQKELKRRCLLITRTDLLPLILHVAQMQYEKVQGDIYDYEKARAYFRNLADNILNSCNMAVISEEYQLDMFLLSCFQRDEMYTYPELLDAIE